MSSFVITDEEIISKYSERDGLDDKAATRLLNPLLLLLEIIGLFVVQGD